MTNGRVCATMAMAVRTSFRDETDDAAAKGRREPGWKSLRGNTVMGHDLAEETRDGQSSDQAIGVGRASASRPAPESDMSIETHPLGANSCMSHDLGAGAAQCPPCQPVPDQPLQHSQ